MQLLYYNMDSDNNNNNNCKIDKIKNKINNPNNKMLNWKRWKLKLMELHRINWFFIVVIFILIVFPKQINSINSCDWTGSGLSTSSHNEREIVSIYLRCTAGKIIWKYPRGAIRVLLRPTFTTAAAGPAAAAASTVSSSSILGLRRNQHNFRVCIKVHRNIKNYEMNSDNNNKNNNNNNNNRINNNQIKLNNNKTNKNDLITKVVKTKQIARIYLEAPKRLISLYDDDNDDQIVKCFMSINQQVALYVEANETPFENLQTIFEYNLEFINNKQYLMMTPLPATVTATTSRGGILVSSPLSSSSINSNSKLSNNYHIDRNDDDDNNVIETNQFLYDDNQYYNTDEHTNDKLSVTDHIKNKKNTDGTWNWLSQWWRSSSKHSIKENKQVPDPVVNDFQINDKKKNIIKFNDSEYYHIIGKFGESWEVCRPCTHIEMVTTYCSSDIVTRGTIFNVQEQPTLNTIELTINHTKILRNNVNAILNAEYSSRTTSMNNNHNNNNNDNNENKRQNNNNNKKRKLLRKIKRNHQTVDNNNMDDSLTTTITPPPSINEIPNDTVDAFKFHTPIHCGASTGDGEFVFMGRIRFQEIMLICAPRLIEWIHVVNTFNATDNAPCILKA